MSWRSLAVESWRVRYNCSEGTGSRIVKQTVAGKPLNTFPCRTVVVHWSLEFADSLPHWQ
jgi:hypothetical protein